MKRLLANTVVVAIGLIALTSPTFAQEWEGLQNNMIETSYVLPSNPANMPTYLIFKDLRVLEELSAFLSPLQLPQRLSIRMAECRTVNMFYDHGEGITLCYEFPRALWRLASEIRKPKGFTRRDVVAGMFVFAALHEVGHAVFDLLEVPVFGRQEDAADQIAALVMLNFGEDFARKHINGAARFIRAIDVPMSRMAFSDEHGSPAQRFYNMLCLAYGAQPENFKEIVEAGTLPKERAAHCGREYAEVEFAFAKTIWPHVDQELFKKVASVKWATWEAEVETTPAAQLLYSLGWAVVWAALIAFLVTKMSTSIGELFHQMTAVGPVAFRGRFDRIHWWAYVLTASLVAYLLSYALDFFQVDFASPQPLRSAHAILEWMILIVLYYWYAVFVTKRLHDRNRQGWLVLFWLAPLVLSAVAQAFPDFMESLSFVLALGISCLLWIWIFIEVGFLHGTRGENRYGPETRY